MEAKPTFDNVLIKANPIENKTKSGFAIPDTAKQKPLQGSVIAVGPGKEGVNMNMVPGDEVLYMINAGTEITLDGEEFIIMKAEDIVLIL